MNLAARLLMTLLVNVLQSIDFDTQIMPIFTKAGCNAGACHGATAGRGGFHLSLLGADPAADYEAVVHQYEGRRVNQVRPDFSLILQKPTGQLEHGGDVVLEEGSFETEQLERWIRAGTPRGSGRQLTGFQVTPRRLTCESLPATVAIQVRAQFDNGPWNDVNHLTVFTSTDPTALRVEDNGQVFLTRRGQHTVIVRFLNQVLPLQLSVPLSDQPVDLSDEPGAGFIDEQIYHSLTQLRIPVSPLADDATWMRRVTLDLTGRLPEPQQIQSFLAEQSPEKRANWIDQLLASEAFNDYWTLKLARLLELHSLPNERAGLDAYAGWLRQQIAQDVGLDQVAHQLLTASGDSHVEGPANFGRMVSDARGQAELVGKVFMGMRLGCANCHNHPLDRWTQDDYHGLAAVFARLDRGRNVRYTDRGQVTNLRTGEPAIPRLPGERDLIGDGDLRLDVSDWVTSRQHSYFARATVNRLWRFMFGRGLVDPTDDLRETNPATHPELLELLTQDFIDNGYRLRHTLRLIALSRTYARSSVVLPGNELDDRFYSRSYRRRLEPEVIVDAIADVTAVANEFEGQPGLRAVQLLDPLAPAPVLDTLGRCNRASGCDESMQSGTGLPSQLHLLNGELINGKLTSEKGRLSRMLAADRPIPEFVNEFYYRGLGRPPTDQEMDSWTERLDTEDPTEKRLRIEDFVWSMLNSRDFLENH